MFNLTESRPDCQPYTDAPAELAPPIAPYTADDADWWAEQNDDWHTAESDDLDGIESRAMLAEALDRIAALGYLPSPTRLTDDDILRATGCVG